MHRLSVLCVRGRSTMSVFRSILSAYLPNGEREREAQYVKRIFMSNMRNVPKKIEIMVVFGILMSRANTSFLLRAFNLLYAKRFIVSAMRDHCQFILKTIHVPMRQRIKKKHNNSVVNDWQCNTHTCGEREHSVR